VTPVHATTLFVRILHLDGVCEKGDVHSSHRIATTPLSHCVCVRVGVQKKRLKNRNLGTCFPDFYF